MSWSIFNLRKRDGRSQRGQGVEHEFQVEPPRLPAWGLGPKEPSAQRTTSPPAESEPEGEADPSIESHAQPRSFNRTFNSSFAGSAVQSFEPRSFDVCSQKTASFDDSVVNPYWAQRSEVPPRIQESTLDPVAASPLYLPSGDVPPSPAIGIALPPGQEPNDAEVVPALSGGAGFSTGGPIGPSSSPWQADSSGSSANEKFLAAQARLEEAYKIVDAAQADFAKVLKEGSIESSVAEPAAVGNSPYNMASNMPAMQPGLWQGAMTWGMPAVWYQPEGWTQYGGDYSGFAYGHLQAADADPEDADPAGEKKSKKKASKAKKQSPGAHAANIAAAVTEEERTTLMLRNIPNNYTRQMLLDLLDEVGLVGQYDFVYLPMDFKSFAGLGYAFVNLASHESAVKAKDILHGFTSWKAASEKVCSVAWGDPLQGYESHVERYRNSPVMHPDVPEKFKPAAFKDGVKIDFPPPTKKIAAPRCKRTNPEPAPAAA